MPIISRTATGLVAVFFAFFVLPYLDARRNRVTTRILISSRIGIDTESSLGHYCRSLGLPVDESEMSLNRSAPGWIEPLPNNLPTVQGDEILELDVRSDKQIQTILSLLDDLPKLRNIRLFGQTGNKTCATATGLQSLVSGLPPIESLAIIDVFIPDNNLGVNNQIGKAESFPL